MSRLWTTIDDMPMRNFVSALCDDNMAALMQRGEYEEKYREDAEERFRDLYIEYTDRMMGKDMGAYSRMKKKILLETRICVLESVMMLVGTKQMTEDVRRAAKKWGVAMSGDDERDMLLLMAGRDKAVREWEKIKGDGEEEVREQDREYFMEMMAAMSSHFKFNIGLGNTAGEVCALYVQMKEEIKSQQKIMKGRNGRKN